MSLADEIYLHFVKHGFTWKIGGEDVPPSLEDIEAFLDKCREVMYDEEDGAMLTTGRLVIHKNDGHLDAYVLIGDLNE